MTKKIFQAYILSEIDYMVDDKTFSETDIKVARRMLRFLNLSSMLLEDVPHHVNTAATFDDLRFQINELNSALISQLSRGELTHGYFARHIRLIETDFKKIEHFLGNALTSSHIYRAWQAASQNATTELEIVGHGRRIAGIV